MSRLGSSYCVYLYLNDEQVGEEETFESKWEAQDRFDELVNNYDESCGYDSVQAVEIDWDSGGCEFEIGCWAAEYGE